MNIEQRKNHRLTEKKTPKLEDLISESKNCSITFEVSEDKAEEFLMNDTRPAFRKAMEQYKKHQQ